MKKIVVIGSLNMDMVINLTRTPQKGETVLTERLELVCGGKGANQAYAMARLGGEVTMLGAVGKDASGQALCENLQKSGVCTDHLMRLEEVSTGTAVVMVSEDGDNSIVVVSGANSHVDRAYIDSKLDCIKACDIVVMQLEIPLDTVVYAARLAKSLGKLVVLDPAPARNDLPDELLACVDLLKPNETELQILLGGSEEDFDLAAARLQERGVQNVLITLGAQGIFVKEQQGKSSHLAAIPVKAVDTTAAGDSFIAGVTVGLARGQSLLQAVHFANYAASIVVTRKGAQSSIPHLCEVQEAMGQECERLA